MDLVLQVDVQVLAIIGALVIPGVVAFVSKRNSPSWFKAAVNAVLSVLATMVAVAIAADGRIDVGQWVTQMLATYGFSELSYQRLWQPSGGSQKIFQRVPGGIGPEAPPRAA